ncbi:MAG: MFS transporter [Clostridia bacterium]|nr:MFS transporter [Clostridia bacterium]
MADEKLRQSDEIELNQAYMNRFFCTTKERVAYIAHKAFGDLKLGKFEVDSDLWLYKILGIEPKGYAKARAALAVYDMINDPVSAAIIDNMRTRWGKFKPFQYLSLIPSIIGGLYSCFIPILTAAMGLNAGRSS